jgi:hypothetical protein
MPVSQPITLKEDELFGERYHPKIIISGILIIIDSMLITCVVHQLSILQITGCNVGLNDSRDFSLYSSLE